MIHPDPENEQKRKKNEEKESKESNGGKKPCWDNYKMVGMKKKNGKRVPNCVYKK